jgi:peptidoglycan/xylan/chitin deacetylase (PgdA/CDA1 family)
MKAIIYKIIACTAYYLGLWRLLYSLYPIIRKRYILTVSTFHRITPKERVKSLVANYDKGYDNKLYEYLLEELNRYFDFIDLDDFIKYVSGEEKPVRHSMLITFDDADSDLAAYAAPILIKNKWPAVVFAPTDYIGSNKVFWHLKITNMMYQMDDSRWQVLKKRKDIFPMEIQEILDRHNTYDNSLHRPICGEILTCLDRFKDVDIYVIIDKFEELIGGIYSLGIKCMNWEQLIELERHGIKIESHTASHRKLTHLDDKDALTEMTASKSIIETKLNKQVKALCYPAGACNSNTEALSIRANYKVAFTTKRGNVQYPLNGLDLFKIPRYTIGGNNRIEMSWEIGKLLIKNEV